MSGAPYLLIFRSLDLKKYLDTTVSKNSLSLEVPDEKFTFGQPYGVFSSLWFCKEYLNKWMSNSAIGRVLTGLSISLSKDTKALEAFHKLRVFFIDNSNGNIFTVILAKDLLDPISEKFGAKHFLKSEETPSRDEPYYISMTDYQFKVLRTREKLDPASKIYVAYLDKGCGNRLNGICAEDN